MAITYKRKDDLEKMLEEFASFENLEKIDISEISPHKIVEKKED